MTNNSPIAVSRWMMLAGYAAVTACTQMLWLSYAPIDTQAARTLNVDVAAVGDLSLIMPLAYIVFSLPFGKWLDRNFKSVLAAEPSAPAPARIGDSARVGRVHGGRIWLEEPSPGSGARFRFTLPASGDAGENVNVDVGEHANQLAQ